MLSQQKLLLAADVLDAVDPDRTIAQRALSCERALERDAIGAFIMTAQLLHGIINMSTTESRGVMTTLRQIIASDDID